MCPSSPRYWDEEIVCCCPLWFSASGSGPACRGRQKKGEVSMMYLCVGCVDPCSAGVGQGKKRD